MKITITAAERESVIQLLESRRQMLLGAVAGMSQEQWHFKPDSACWSIAEIVEHLATVEAFVLTLIQARVLAEAITETLECNDLLLQTRVAGRRSKVQASEVVRPKGRLRLEAELIAAFCAARDNTIAYAASTQDDLRHHTGAHPSLGALDGYQWLLFLAAHTERHIAQIRELQQVSEYPVASRIS